MNPKLPTLRLTEDFDGFSFLNPRPRIEMFCGQIMLIDGDYAGGIDHFLNHLVGILPSKMSTKFLQEEDVSHLSIDRLHGLGMRYSTGRRRVMGSLTVEEHLRLRLMSTRNPQCLDAAKEQLVHWIPILRNLFGTLAGDLSGGQQQMVMLGVAAICKPMLLVLDEPFMGLAANARSYVESMFRTLLDDGTVMVVAESIRDDCNWSTTCQHSAAIKTLHFRGSTRMHSSPASASSRAFQ